MAKANPKSAAVRERAARVGALMQLPFLTAEEAGDILAISPSQVRRLVGDGSLEAIRLGSRSIRIRPSALDVIGGPRVTP